MATQAKSIKAKCLDCSGDVLRNVTLCSVVECPLWLYRFGKRPATVRARTPLLLDKAYVLLCGAVDDFGCSDVARRILADPRKYYPAVLRGHSDADIAAMVAHIKATPRSDRFRPKATTQEACDATATIQD
jgi:hypothetical protein